MAENSPVETAARALCKYEGDNWLMLSHADRDSYRARTSKVLSAARQSDDVPILDRLNDLHHEIIERLDSTQRDANKADSDYRRRFAEGANAAYDICEEMVDRLITDLKGT